MQDMILISGEALIDLIPDPVKQNGYDAVLGGSPYNVAIGLARLGSKTAFVSRISADGNGEALAAGLAGNGVELAYVLRDKRPTTLAFVMRGTAKTGSRYSFYLDATSFDGPWPFPATWPKDAAPPACGSISAVDPRHGERVVEALKATRPHATVSYDPNIRPLVTPDRGVRRGARRAAGLARQCGQGERGRPPMALPRPCRRGQPCGLGRDGPRFCVATLGERGALAVLGRERIEVPAPPVEVVDTVGAGDSFMSALLSAMDMIRRSAPSAQRRTAPLLERWLRFAAAASAITCTRKGSDPPTRAEVEAALSARISARLDFCERASVAGAPPPV